MVIKNLFKDLVTYGRHNSKGKKEFIEYIKIWGKENLNTFEITQERSLLNLNYREVANIILLFINSVILFFVLQKIGIGRMFFDIFYFFVLYIIQFRLSFLLLSLIVPSTNIIFNKNPKLDNNREIIICAHYDTKNSFSNKPKGKIKSVIKYNAYGISRILGMYLYRAEKVMLLLMLGIYIFYFLDTHGSIQTSYLISNYPKILGSLTYDLGVILLISSFFIMILMWLFTYPFCNNINNEGADDNTSGVIGALEIAKRLNNINIDANIKIILFDNEERGLIGSSHFVAKNIKKLKNKNLRIINLDCIGRGEKIFVSAENKEENNNLKALKNDMDKGNIDYSCINVDYSDHKPFICCGFEAVSIGRYDSKKYLWFKEFPMIDWIHGSEDNQDAIDFEKIEEVINIVFNSIIEHKKNAEILRTL